MTSPDDPTRPDPNTEPDRSGPPSTAEIAALTARLRALSNAGAAADEAERAAFLADTQQLLDRIPAIARIDLDTEVPPNRADPAVTPAPGHDWPATGPDAAFWLPPPAEGVAADLDPATDDWAFSLAEPSADTTGAGPVGLPPQWLAGVEQRLAEPARPDTREQIEARIAALRDQTGHAHPDDLTPAEDGVHVPTVQQTVDAVERANRALAELRARADADPAEVEVVGLVCPECGEDAIDRPPAALVPYQAQDQARPEYSHRDGEPLCPVMGPRGYQPAEPAEVLADPPPATRRELDREGGTDPPAAGSAPGSAASGLVAQGRTADTAALVVTPRTGPARLHTEISRARPARAPGAADDPLEQARQAVGRFADSDTVADRAALDAGGDQLAVPHLDDHTDQDAAGEAGWSR